VSKHIIELNGKRYDALTGALLGNSEPAVAEVTAKRAKSARKGQFIDGIVSPAKARAFAPSAPKSPRAVTTHYEPKPATYKVTQPLPGKSAVKRSAAKIITPHQAEHPKTLMRSAVKKPQITIKPAIKTQTPAEIMAKPTSAIVPKNSAAQVNPARRDRAKQTTQNRMVRRFDIAPAARPNAPQRSAAPARPQVHAAAPTPRHAATLAATAQKPAATRDIFEAALAHATSHEQVRPQHKRRKHHRFINIAAGVAAFLIIGGFVAYLNAPNIEMHVASVRAGFSAQLPGYKPEGYALNGPIKSQDGQIRVSFRSGSSNFAITQQASDWDSQTLLDNAVALSSNPHQTVESKGRTIYVYSGGQATWVNGGVRYDLSGNANLSTADVAAIASSM
jgi:hypothetical protein